jgi:hypothetical protein
MVVAAALLLESRFLRVATSRISRGYLYGDQMSGFPHEQQDDDKTVELLDRLHFSKKLQAVTNKIHSTNNLDEIMLDLSKDICDLFSCDRLTLYAISKDGNFIFSKVKTGINSNKDLVLPLNADSIAGHVALFKRSVRISDVYDEEELKTHEPELKFRREVDQITAYRTKQMLAAPLINANSGELLGVIQLLNHRDGEAFSARDEEGLKELCETMAIAFIQRTKTPSAIHSKYEFLVADSIISAPELELAARWARRKNLDVEEALTDEFQVQLASIGQALSKSFKVPYESYKASRVVPTQLIKKIQRDQVEKAQWLPISEDQAGLVILTTDPEHVNDARAIHQIFPYSRLFFRVTTKREFKQTIDQFFKSAGAQAF